MFADCNNIFGPLFKSKKKKKFLQVQVVNQRFSAGNKHPPGPSGFNTVAGKKRKPLAVCKTVLLLSVLNYMLV